MSSWNTYYISIIRIIVYSLYINIKNMSIFDKFKAFVNEKEPTYENGDLRIVFNKQSGLGGILSAKHYGWRCPSMYNDSPYENGCCEHDRFELHKRLILNFTEDNYSEREYLRLLVPDDFLSLEVLDDDHNRKGLILKLKE